jgi:preprotein translocase subunit SecE
MSPRDASGKIAQMAQTNPFQFIQQVRSEVSKVVWPTRREVLLTTVMVFITATLTAIFFALVDLAIRSGLQGILGIFG